MMTTKTATIKREFSNPLEHDLMKMDMIKMYSQRWGKIFLQKKGLHETCLYAIDINKYFKSSQMNLK
jgi:hypothetical protein